MARYVAKNVVAARLADVCELQLSYAIGVANPTSVLIECFGTERVSTAKIERAIRKNFVLTPQGIISTLKLRRPIYRHTAYHGHFGNSNYSWEKTNVASRLAKDAGV